LDLPAINARLQSLDSSRTQKPYQRQTSRLQQELETFLASLPLPKTLVSTSPEDLIRFLIWKDKSGKTKVHIDPCRFFGSNNRRTNCTCPSRLAAGTIENYIAKLRTIFSSIGPMESAASSSSFNPGNPANHPHIYHYLKSIREEQAQARVTPKQAVPLFFNKFLALSSHIKKSLLQPGINPTSCFIYARDLAFFCLDFYSGERASDLGQLKTHDVLCLPDNQGLLFRHTFGKTLRGQHTHMFAVKPSASPSCPVTNLRSYILLCDRMNINLRHGFLFRTTDKHGCVTDAPFLGSAVTNRLKKYLGQLHLDDGETAHSFRAGCSNTLSLLGASQEEVAKHIGWRSVSTAAYYTQTDAVMSPTSTSTVLTDSVIPIDPMQPPPAHQLGALFRSRNNLEGFSLAFP
jgi:integrase